MLRTLPSRLPPPGSIPHLVKPVLCFVRDEPVTGWARDVMVCSTSNLVDMLQSRAPVFVVPGGLPSSTAGSPRRLHRPRELLLGLHVRSLRPVWSDHVPLSHRGRPG